MKPATAAKPKSRREFFWMAVFLAALLALLFWKSFAPGFVQFSNDGPLGQQMVKWLQLPQSFTGAWDDLNDIGANAGMFPLDITALIRWAFGPVGFSKFYVPVALCILGLCAWTFFKQLKLTPLAAVLGALAASLASLFFSNACWGVGSHQIALGMDFLALSLVVSNSPGTSPAVRWIRLALAGLAVGVNVTEAADIGAVFSLFVAAFVLFHSLNQEGGGGAKKIGRGIGQVLVIAIFAGFFAVQTITGLLSAFGSSVTNGEALETKAQHWNWSTQWSLPKIETFGVVVPGLFGYRMDTPGGGNYWGATGRDPAWDQYFANQGPQPDPQQQYLRFSGDGDYAGILVLLVAIWTIAQSLRGQNSVFSETYRRSIWFWTALLIVSLLLAWGRYAPFYSLLYQLPFFSTQFRNPNKFLFVFTWALVIIFACGVHGLSRRYLEVPATGSTSLGSQLKNWRAKIRGFDRNWTIGCVIAFACSLLAWLIYAGEKPALVRHLKIVGFGDEKTAKEIAAFSITEVGWFILFFALAAALIAFILAGIFAGRRAKWAGIFLGALLIVDLGRADLPWIVHWNYEKKYDIDPNNPDNSVNPILNFFREKSYEHRVAILPFNPPGNLIWFNELYRIEWAQHHFPYYNIQSLDIIQNPRPASDLEMYDRALAYHGPATLNLIARRWELAGTDYLLGAAGFLDVLNGQLDPVKQRFRIIKRFNVTLKPGVEEFHSLEDLTAVPDDNGEYALFDFTGALPRAKLFSNWIVSTNDAATLQTLTSTNFDPARTVLVSTQPPISAGAGTNLLNAGTVEYASYAPKKIKLNVNAVAPSVLLLNDKFDSNWRVFVDGQRAGLLRCNFIMRGVYIAPGAHTVEFQFKLPDKPFFVTLIATVAGILLIGILVFSTRQTKSK